MANLDTIRKTFDSYLSDNWNVNYITWDNTERPLTQDVEWIRPFLSVENSENVTIGGYVGNYRIRHTGTYIIQVFTPINKGIGDINRTVDELFKLFNNKTLHPDIFIYASTIDRLGDEGNGWYQINVSIPFTADQLDTD
ncbi:MAG: phage tail terminator-like protein [Melioribacteraceae bacterium]|nr:phage tail terminator-like protein [Melioribacteraceae bacterium]